MRKIIIITALFIGLTSCNSNSSSNSTSANGDTTNETGLTNPTAIDTTKHPDGVINGDVISTDTAAMNVQNSIDKRKAAGKQPK